MARTGGGWRWVWVLAAVLLVCVAGYGEDVIAVTDSAGQPAGSLPLQMRGSEALIPLRTLARLADWRVLQSESLCTVSLRGAEVAFRTDNPFAKVNGRYVQMRIAPETWDGSLWLPALNLDALFGPDVRLMNNGLTLMVASLSVTVAKPRDGAERWALHTIIVDPGHGGKDPGAPGPPGWHEKSITLDIARRLTALIEKKGLTARLTRSKDEFVSLQDRTHYANSMHGDLFLSIHCNSNRDKSVHGVEAYCLKPARTARAVEVAVRENSVVKLEDTGAEYRDLTQENYILLSMATSQNLKDSETWAAQATAQTATRCKLASRGVDQAGFYVLMGAQMPAVLVECGYLSSASDAKILISEQGRQAIAEALLNSILDMKTKLETAASR
ncbi:MAG TPA: N-acetylmuramoyl-L-alanine amidase [bacterium]